MENSKRGTGDRGYNNFSWSFVAKGRKPMKDSSQSRVF